MMIMVIILIRILTLFCIIVSMAIKPIMLILTIIIIRQLINNNNNENNHKQLIVIIMKVTSNISNQIS